jgi:hypothetical protein
MNATTVNYSGSLARPPKDLLIKKILTEEGAKRLLPGEETFLKSLKQRKSQLVGSFDGYNNRTRQLIMDQFGDFTDREKVAQLEALLDQGAEQRNEAVFHFVESMENLRLAGGQENSGTGSAGNKSGANGSVSTKQSEKILRVEDKVLDDMPEKYSDMVNFMRISILLEIFTSLFSLPQFSYNEACTELKSRFADFYNTKLKGLLDAFALTGEDPKAIMERASEMVLYGKNLNFEVKNFELDSSARKVAALILKHLLGTDKLPTSVEDIQKVWDEKLEKVVTETAARYTRVSDKDEKGMVSPLLDEAILRLEVLFKQATP